MGRPVAPRLWPSRKGETAEPLFCQRLAQHIGPLVRGRLDQLQPKVLVFRRRHLADQRRIHAVIL